MGRERKFNHFFFFFTNLILCIDLFSFNFYGYHVIARRKRAKRGGWQNLVKISSFLILTQPFLEGALHNNREEEVVKARPDSSVISQKVNSMYVVFTAIHVVS